MKILVACEVSGIVRDAFLAKGHEAYSCDFTPSESKGPHILNDARNVLDWGWDLMIAFPPCTHLTVSGARWFKSKPAHLRQDALALVRCLMNAPIARIAIENPVGIISSVIRKPDQIVQPWQFGNPEAKRTCLWLHNLPKLQATDVLPLPECGYWRNQTPTGQNKLSSSKAALRAKTYPGIAAAMADQWG